MEIATGTPEQHPTPLPLGTIPVPGVTPVTGQLSGPTVPARDTTGEQLAQQSAGEADVRAAQAAGMSAENDRRSGYMTQVGAHGSAYGDPVNLPPVPDSVLPPPPAGGYPFAGDEPVA